MIGSMDVDKIPLAGGSITCLDCGNFYITNATMNNSISLSGGALYLELTEQRKEKYILKNEYTVKIVSSVFANSHSLSVGGAIHLNNQFRVLFQSNTLNDNYASTQGGGLYMECLSPFDCKYNMQGTNTFKNNYANSSGGAIYWGDVQPTLLSGANYQFESNKALIYADNIGSYPQKLVSLTKEQYQAQLLRASVNSAVDSSRRLRDLQVSNSSTSSSQDSQRSGDTLPTMYIGLADAMGQLVGTESSKKLDVSLKGTLSNGTNSMKYQATIAGTTTFYSLNGVYVLKDIIFTGAPGENYQLSFASDGIDPDKPANKDPIIQSALNSTAIDFDLNISLRECQVGEKFTDAGACDPCPIEKSYSLVKMTEPGQCKTCPTSKAVCNGGSNIGPQPGYWRKNNVTGMVPPQNDPQGQCYTGYAGILCADCNPGYSVTGAFQCGKCPEYAQNIFRIVAIILVGIVVIILLIRSTLQGAADVKNITSVFQKILLNHIQLIVLTASFDFSWPQIVMDYFKSSETVGEASNQIFSVDCFLNSDDGYEKNKNSTYSSAAKKNSFIVRIFYFKLAMFGLLPLLLVVLCYIAWSLIYRKSQDKSILMTKATSSVVILLFLVHPNIVKYVFNAFNCIDIDGESRIKNDLEIVCYTKEHILWALGVALPSLIVWGLGIPFFAFLLLLKERKTLESLITRQKYGFLYRGFKRRFFYWEIVITYRKIFLIFIQIFLVQYGVITQAMLVLLMLIFFMSINLTKSPFQTLALNELETVSIITSLLTIFCGIFFIVAVDTVDVETGESSSDSQVTLTDGTQLLLFAIILVSNISFFVYWAYKMLSEVQNMLIKKFAKLYTIFCLCGDKKKYELKLEAALIKEDNELLRERYQDILRQLSIMCDNGELMLNEKVLEKVAFYLRKDRVLQSAGIEIDSEAFDDAAHKIKRTIRQLAGIKQRQKIGKTEKMDEVDSIEQVTEGDQGTTDIKFQFQSTQKNLLQNDLQSDGRTQSGQSLRLEKNFNFDLKHQKNRTAQHQRYSSESDKNSEKRIASANKLIEELMNSSELETYKNPNSPSAQMKIDKYVAGQQDKRIIDQTNNSCEDSEQQVLTQRQMKEIVEYEEKVVPEDQIKEILEMIENNKKTMSDRIAFQVLRRNFVGSSQQQKRSVIEDDSTHYKRLRQDKIRSADAKTSQEHQIQIEDDEDRSPILNKRKQSDEEDYENDIEEIKYEIYEPQSSGRNLDNSKSFEMKKDQKLVLSGLSSFGESQNNDTNRNLL
ncbi:UNKNOWN [Stylonychia lemnae]|uniref:Uncharacterized protein n=1 Tax=Stylonychia lemnae TaxID=5949 RepID=A0A078AN62_STYLE|nr:UNKNOWN [Stylonychia lemnae]|eukprot:CDW82348.1 UNKNOWN [Stylonychia lemnae]